MFYGSELQMYGSELARVTLISLNTSSTIANGCMSYTYRAPVQHPFSGT